jgi:hypothetical protein
VLALGIALRPRFGKPPKERVLTRESAQKLFEIVDRVAAALDTHTVDLVALDRLLRSTVH